MCDWWSSQNVHKPNYGSMSATSTHFKWELMLYCLHCPTLNKFAHSYSYTSSTLIDLIPFIICDLEIEWSKVSKERLICSKPRYAMNKLSNNMDVEENHQQTLDQNLTRKNPDIPDDGS